MTNDENIKNQDDTLNDNVNPEMEKEQESIEGQTYEENPEASADTVSDKKSKRWCLLFYGPLIYKIKEFVESPSPKVKFKMGFYCSWRALGSSEEEFPDAEDVQLLE